MYCKVCGTELSDDANVCSQCGAVVNNKFKDNSSKKVVFAKQSQVGFILGIIGLFAWVIAICGYAVGVAGLITSIKEYKNGSGKKAVLGIVFSCICLVLSLGNSILGVLLNNM